jgi:hypothetical protein
MGWQSQVAVQVEQMCSALPFAARSIASRYPRAMNSTRQVLASSQCLALPMTPMPGSAFDSSTC